MARFDRDYPGFKPEDIVASICAYEEEKATSATCWRRCQTRSTAAPTRHSSSSTAATDSTAEIARSFPGVKVIEFPVNLGHGVALQVTYRYCIDNSVKYVVTLDADGQNDPAEIPQILAPPLQDDKPTSSSRAACSVRTRPLTSCARVACASSRSS